MEVRDLYQFVLMIVLVGMLIGVGILMLDKFAQTDGVTAAAGTALNETRDAVAGISSNWLPLIITIAVLGILIVLVLRSFGGGEAR